jgi:predicted nuclease with TOPRIM domain
MTLADVHTCSCKCERVKELEKETSELRSFFSIENHGEICPLKSQLAEAKEIIQLAYDLRFYSLGQDASTQNLRDEFQQRARALLEKGGKG